MKDKNDPGRALAAYFRQMAQHALPFRLLICPAGPWKRPWLRKIMPWCVMALGRWRSTKGSVTAYIGSSACSKCLSCGHRPANLLSPPHCC